jgi:hypothetical protein
MGGGGGYFDGFALGALDQTNTNGKYRLATSTPTKTSVTAIGSVAAYAAPTYSNTDTLYIHGYGTEVGRDGTNLVQAYAMVSSSGITTSILN